MNDSFYQTAVFQFLENSKKIINHSKHIKGFPITRGSNTFSIKSDSYILGDRFCKDKLETQTFWKITFNLGLLKLIHY